MIPALGRTLARLIGIVLIAAVVWYVGWSDRVRDAEGNEYSGRIVGQTRTSVTLETTDGRRTIALTGAARVQRGLRSAFAPLLHRPFPALAGILLQLAGIVADSLRWHVLLRGAGLATPLRTVCRLTWVGNFFSDVLPVGSTGGDVVKAVSIARIHSASKTTAVLTVFMDRIVGFAVLTVLGGVAVFWAPRAGELALARAILLSLAAVSLVVIALICSRRLRHLLPVPALPERWRNTGLILELRQAVRLYSNRRRVVLGALGIAVLGHAISLSSFFCYASAVNASLPLLAVLVAIPVAQVLAAVPGLPGGWGLGDFAFLFFLPAVGVDPAVAVVLSFLHRIVHTLLSLPGGLLLAGSSASQARVMETP